MLLLALAVGGCGPLVQVGGNAPLPVVLHTLTASQPTANDGAGAVNLARSVTVDVPTVPGALRTLRMPVTVSETAIQYVRSAQWSEQPNRLFQRVLAETLAGTGIPVIDARSSGMVGQRRLTGQLTAFGVDVRGPEPVARIRFEATLLDGGEVQQRLFVVDEPLAAVEGPGVAAALNRGANQVAADVAAWVRGGGGGGT
jgi:cholesterol transport system auxiliary component